MDCSMPEVSLRAATRADVPDILRIYNHSVATDTASWDTAPQPLKDRLAWFDARVATGQAVLVAVEDGRVVGWGSWGPFRTKDGYRHTREHTLYVDADARGRGVGRLLLQGILDTARAAGVHVLLGALSNENDASAALHRAFGFVEVGRLPQAGAKFGRWLDLVLVQLVLDDRPTPA